MDLTTRSWSHIYSSFARPDSFRLLELGPAADVQGALKGSLAATTLERIDIDIVTRYTALSYVWGNPTPVGSIAINGSNVGITANLTQALRDIRHTSRAVVLWVDALCINQQGPKKQSQQVRIMGDIYRRAATTIIYLGPYKRNVQFLFNHIAAMNLLVCTTTRKCSDV